MLYTEPGFPMKSTVVPAWYNRAGFLSATARSIAQAMSPLSAEDREEAQIVYSAQGLPRKYVDDLGDPYEEQVGGMISA